MFNLRDGQYRELIKRLVNYEQKCIGFNGEGSCKAGNHIFSVTTFFIPLKSGPSSIQLSSITYHNCQNLEIWKKNKYGFITRSTVIADGEAYCSFNWEVVF